MTRRFRIDLAYDGTDFEGWQSQKEKGRTVQTEIESALGQILKKPTPIVGAGRTDSGVHARCQTAHFDVETTRMQGENFVRGLNSFLPSDVRILECREVDSRFHSRFSALARVYHYYFRATQSLLPWESRYCYRIRSMPDVQVLNAMAGHLRGEIDFTTFTHAQDPSASRNRFIYHASFFPQRDQLVFRIAGNAFLWRMVRSLVGTMIDLGTTGGTAADFGRILASRDRKQVGPTAPANGLFLHKVVYDAHEFAF